MSAATTPIPGSFVQRAIDVTFTLGSGATFNGAADTVKLSGLRVSAAITNSGGISQGALDLRVYGMPISTMNKLQVIGGVPLVMQANNTVTIEAGSADGSIGMNVVYQGTIASAWPNYQNAPEVPFHVLGFAALLGAVKPVAPSSFRGGADVATIMSGLAKTMGFSFENNGVSVQLSNPYFAGTAYQQAEACAAAANINMTVDRNTLAIWPRGGNRAGTVPLVSPTTGLVGYPIRTPLGVELTTLYNPAIKFGSQIKVESSLQPACGIWNVTSLDHTLESMVPDGAWFSRVTCLPVGFI